MAIDSRPRPKEKTPWQIVKQVYKEIGLHILWALPAWLAIRLVNKIGTAIRKFSEWIDTLGWKLEKLGRGW